MIKISLAVLLCLLAIPVSALAQEGPIAEAFAKQSDAVRAFDQHVTTLSNPWFEGRVPGSRGMELAREYMEWHFRRTGLAAPFEGEDGARSYMQPFALGSRREFTAMTLSAGDKVLKPKMDYLPLSVGGTGEVEGDLVFVGYGIDNGPDGFTNFGEGKLDLTGKIAVMFRFEPMNDEGKSLWSDGARAWTTAAGFIAKLNTATERGAKAVVIVNPPDCADPRTRETPKDIRGQTLTRVPVLLASTDAGARLMKAAGCKKSMAALRKHADEGGDPVVLGTGRVTATIADNPLMAKNVAGLLEGKGKLADELLVLGGHLDHLGFGSFGSRARRDERGRVLHPGADDNATGAAATIMIAEALAKMYAELPEDADARSILFVGFDAEESGLNGSRHYVRNPIMPIEKHALMVNFDMIGRVQNNRLSVSGLNSAKDMEEWVQPLLDDCPLECSAGRFGSGGSDHASFNRAGVPYLFAIGSLHADYHTPRDVAWKINRVAGAQVVELFGNILKAAATRETIERTEGSRRRRD